MLTLLQAIFVRDGIQFVYHGVNVIPAYPPYYPDTAAYSADFSFSQADVDFLKQNSLNAVVL